MIAIRRIRRGEADLFKRLRLESLQDAPYAFSSSYESALRRSPQSWREQADSSANGFDRATFIAFSDDAPIGIAALYRLQDQPDVGEVLQVWVAPEHRGTGIARNLLDFVFEWTSNNMFRAVIAIIKTGNVRALRFYRSYGFVPTDEALPRDSGEVTLVREVHQSR